MALIVKTLFFSVGFYLRQMGTWNGRVERSPNNLRFYHDTKNIDRIYYINLETHHGRREMMEKWLSEQPIPYERVNAMNPELLRQWHRGHRQFSQS